MRRILRLWNLLVDILEAEGTVHGDVYESAAHQVWDRPIEGATIMVRREQGPVVAEAHTNAEGKYSVRVRKGVYPIWVEKDGYDAPPESIVEVVKGQSVNKSFTLTAQYGTVEGLVSDEVGAPVGDATVRLRAP